MTAQDAAVLVFGVSVVLGGLALAYRYTISPKAAARMAEANRKYVPWGDRLVNWRGGLIGVSILAAARFAAAVVTGYWILWILAVTTTAVEAFAIYKAWAAHKARTKTATPGRG